MKEKLMIELPENPTFTESTLFHVAAMLAKIMERQRPAEPIIKEVEKIVTVEKPVEIEKIVEVEKEVVKEVVKPVDAPFTQQLTPLRELLRQTLQDGEIARTLNVSADKNEGGALLALAANLAQWDKLAFVWQQIAQRCKNEKRAADAFEQRLLQAGVDFYNLTGKSAALAEVPAGAKYDFETMQELTAGTGDTVAECSLKGLHNGVKLVHKPIVRRG